MLTRREATRLALLGLTVLAGLTAGTAVTDAEAGYRGQRQYYSSWSYRPARTYHYSTYYYKPTPSYPSYNYHYCISYPSRPRYVYYYNPHSSRYWGRFDMQGKPGQQYSLLAEKDRKENLDDIPESAFPAPGPMPSIPEAADGAAIEAPAPAPLAPLPEVAPAQ